MLRFEAERIRDALKNQNYYAEIKKGKVFTSASKENAEHILVDADIIPEPKKYGNISNTINDIEIVFGED